MTKGLLGAQPGGYIERLDYDKKEMRFTVSIYSPAVADFMTIDITGDFKAAIDLEHLRTCWMVIIKGRGVEVRDIQVPGEAYGPKPAAILREEDGKVSKWKRAIGVFLTLLIDNEAVNNSPQVLRRTLSEAFSGNELRDFAQSFAFWTASTSSFALASSKACQDLEPSQTSAE